MRCLKESKTAASWRTNKPAAVPAHPVDPVKPVKKLFKDEDGFFSKESN